MAPGNGLLAVVEKDVVIRVEGSARLEDLLDGREVVDQLAVESQFFRRFVNFDLSTLGTFGFLFDRFVLLGNLEKQAGTELFDGDGARGQLFVIVDVHQRERQKLVKEAVVPAQPGREKVNPTSWGAITRG